MSLPKELVKEIREAVERGSEIVIISNSEEREVEIDKLIESIQKETEAKSNKEEEEDIKEDLLLSTKNKLEDSINSLRVHIKFMKSVHRLLSEDVETPPGAPSKSERLDSIQKAEEKLKRLENDIEMVHSIEKLIEISK